MGLVRKGYIIKNGLVLYILIFSSLILIDDGSLNAGSVVLLNVRRFDVDALHHWLLITFHFPTWRRGFDTFRILPRNILGTALLEAEPDVCLVH